MRLPMLDLRDLDLLDAELVGVKPDYVSRLSPGAVAEYNKQVDAYYAKGIKPDDVDRAMGSYGPSYFEDKARAATRTTTTRAPVARAAGAAAVAAKSCGADGDMQAWLLFALCVIVLCLVWLAMSRARPSEEQPRCGI